MEDGVVIRTAELTKRYPGMDRPAVDDLDLEVHRGEIFGLLGPNGADKTTTAGMLTTRVLPTSGRAEVGGVDVIRHPAVAKQVIGVVPQQNTLDRALDVWENLYFHGRFFGYTAKESRAAADRSLEQFHLARRSCSSTSRRPDSTRRVASPSGRSWASSTTRVRRSRPSSNATAAPRRSSPRTGIRASGSR